MRVIAPSDGFRMMAKDHVETNVLLDENRETVIWHKASITMNEYGERDCTRLFSGVNRAFIVDEIGRVHPPGLMQTRALPLQT